jgi:hypothetical protein
MAREPILDLSTLVPDRTPIRIDGKTYHLKSPDELTLFDAQQFTTWGKELEAVGTDPTAAEADLEPLVRKVARHALADVPDEVFDRLSGSQAMRITEVFTGLLLARRLKAAGAIAQTVTRPTGVKSSPSSKPSSAATPAGGSTRPRRRS